MRRVDEANAQAYEALDDEESKSQSTKGDLTESSVTTE